MNENLWLIIGALSTGLAVVFGAFGAHALEQILSEARLETYQTAVEYQFYHGLALVLVQILKSLELADFLDYIGTGFTLGIIFFSGSLYILVLTDTAWLGAITPIGGTLFVISWVLLVYGAIRAGV